MPALDIFPFLIPREIAVPSKMIHEITRSGRVLFVRFRVISWIVLVKKEEKRPHSKAELDNRALRRYDVGSVEANEQPSTYQTN
jgi:hypothetical protein